MKRRVRAVRQKWTKRQLLVRGLQAAVGLAAIIVIAQCIYPNERMVPWQRIDSHTVGNMTAQEAAKQLDQAYAKSHISLQFGNATHAQLTPGLSEFGLSIHNTARMEQVKYPWYLRLVPGSLLWAHLVIKTPAPEYRYDQKALDAYLQKHLGDDCRVAPKNATAKVSGNTLIAVRQQDGGTCRRSEVRTGLASVKPLLGAQTVVRAPLNPMPAKLTLAQIQPVVATLNTQLAKPLVLQYDDKTQTLDPTTVRSWLQFSTENDVFEIRFDTAKADVYLGQKLAKALERPAGISKVTTRDFVEVSRQDGQTGRKLDSTKTLENLKLFLLAKTAAIAVGEVIVAPQVQYTRSYSNTDTGLSALIKNYAESHPGTYGVSLVELDGKRRRATYNDTQKFTTASTYKLYVAFSTLKRIESGEFKWSDQVAGGRDLARCFDDMIVKSDNACAEAVVARIGYTPITKDAQTIVSPSTTFLDKESYKTTAGDLSTFMASLATGQIPLGADSKARFLDALKRNVYRQGIPAGATGTVADKVGFLDGLLHDAAIVYSPSGTYALSIMTDKSSWANIAELTKEIEKLRVQ